MAAQERQDGNQVSALPAAGTTFLIMIQVVSRLLTFASNQLVLRHMSPEVLGVAAHLELYSITVLYFSRECLRTAIQREPPAESVIDTSDSRTSVDGVRHSPATYTSLNSIASQTVVNMSYLAMVLGVPLAALFALGYCRWATEVFQTPSFLMSLQIVGISCLLELATEPFFAIVQHRMLYKERAVVETTAAVAKSLMVCTAAVWAARVKWNAGVLPFALGYLAYASTLIFVYIWQMSGQCTSKEFSFWLTPIHSRYLGNRFSWRLTWLAANVYLQLIVKHLLTQGDSMILAALSSLEDQGIYSLVSNYGGLVARILFQPIEESSRNMFSRQLNSEGPHDRKKVVVESSRSHLIDILRAYGILAILTISIGPTVVPLALQFLIGSHWMSSKVESLLSAYCYYIPFLAFNGITEAFVSAAVNAAEMRRQAAWMGIFSASFAAVSFLFLRLAGWGALGLVLANIINMSIRTLWSWLYIQAYLQQYNLNLAIPDISPGLQTIGISALAMSVMIGISPASRSNLYDIVKTVGIGVLCALIILYSERQYLLDLYKRITKTSKTTK